MSAIQIGVRFHSKGPCLYLARLSFVSRASAEQVGVVCGMWKVIADFLVRTLLL